jgi:hypothetical protein
MVSYTLHKVAKRIGMVRMGDGWADPPSCLVSAGDSTLRYYLLTGDRPMRILEKYLLVVTPAGGGNKCERWLAFTWIADGAFGTEMCAPTPAEAILACAEACV